MRVGSAVLVGDGVRVGVGIGVRVGTGVTVDVAVAEGVAVTVAVGVAVLEGFGLTGVGVDVKVADAVGTAVGTTEAKSPLRLSLPPVTVLPEREDVARVLAKSTDLIWAAVADGNAEAYNAIAPVT